MANEFDGQKYRCASQHQFEWGTKLIAELNLAGDESILDLGCGDGRLTAQLGTLVPHGRVIGIDSSAGMLKAAQDCQAGNVQSRLLDINELTFDGEFDLVFSNATLNWVKDHRLLHRNILRALKPGGRARFNFAGDGNCSNFIEVIREVMTLPRYASCFAKVDWPWYMPSVGDYLTLVRDFSYSAARVWGENADRFFADADTMVKWIDQPSLVPFLRHVTDPADRQDFRDAVVERVIARTRQSDGRCFETFRRINLLARKGSLT